MKESTVELRPARDQKGRKIRTEDGKSIDRGRGCGCWKPVPIEYHVPYTGLSGEACATCRGTLGTVW